MSSTGSQTPPIVVTSEMFDAVSAGASAATAVMTTKTACVDPRALPFNAKTHTAVEVIPSDKLYPLVLGYVARHASADSSDAAFRAFAKQGAKASGRRGRRPPVPAHRQGGRR